MRTILLYIFWSLLATITLIIAVIVKILTFAFDRKGWGIHYTISYAARIFYGFWGKLFWRYKIIGAENIAPDGVYVAVYNHQSMVDIPTFCQLNYNFRCVAKREVHYIPIFGQLIFLHHAITIDRGNPRVAIEKVVREGKKWLEKGVSVNVFPEGTRSSDGEIHRFKSGAFTLAKSANVEILPVVIDGTHDIFIKGFFMDWKRQITIKVLPPISAEVVATTDTKDLMESTQSMMEEALKSIRNK